jgi:hypothetical protein
MFPESLFAAWLTPRISAQPANPLTAALVIRLTFPPELGSCVCARIVLHKSRFYVIGRR